MMAIARADRTDEWREHRRQYEAQWRATHADSIRESKAKYRLLHPDDERANKRRWRARNPQWWDAYYATAESRRRYLFYNVKSRAKRNGTPFTLKFRDMVWPEFCPVFGVRIDYGLKGRERKPDSPSLDRTDPTKGYTPDNVVVMSWRANEIKRNATLTEVEMLMTYLRKAGVAPNA